MDYSPRYARFRALLRRIREEAGLSQAELAKRLRRPQTFVSKSELGERRVDALEAADFCAACNVTIGQFFARLARAGTGAGVKPRQKRRSPRRMDRHGRVSD